jgi:hypothetical protein
MVAIKIVVEKPSADTKTKPKPTHLERLLETAAKVLADFDFINAYFLNFVPLCGMKHLILCCQGASHQNYGEVG